MIRPRKIINNMSSVFKPSTRMGEVGRGIGGRVAQHAVAKPAAKTKPKAEEAPLDKKAVRRRRIIMGILAALFIGVGLFSASVIFAKDAGVEPNPDYQRYMSILTEEERAAWEELEQEKGKAYVQINLRVIIDSQGKADLRLINPLYSSYKQKMKITLEGGDEPIYQSEMLLPGTVVEFCDIKGLQEGDHKAVAEFVFYDGDDVERGDYKLDIQLDVE